MISNENMEVARTDEELDSKSTAGVEPVGGSIPSASAVKRRGRAKVINDIPLAPSIIRYKLNLYKVSGGLRADLSAGLVRSMLTNWPELIYVIPSERFISFDEIKEKIDYIKLMASRVLSDNMINDGLEELRMAGIIVVEHVDNIDEL